MKWNRKLQQKWTQSKPGSRYKEYFALFSSPNGNHNWCLMWWIVLLRLEVSQAQAQPEPCRFLCLAYKKLSMTMFPMTAHSHSQVSLSQVKRCVWLSPERWTAFLFTFCRVAVPLSSLQDSELLCLLQKQCQKMMLDKYASFCIWVH